MVSVDLDARRRAAALAKGVVQPLYRPLTFAAVAAGAGGFLAAVLTVLTRDVIPGLAGGAALATLIAVIGWRTMADADFRAAAELVYDHTCHELAEWKRTTGTSMPRTRAGQMRWLDEHPASAGRASLLLVLGRLTEADAAIDAIEPATPEDRFDVGLLRATRTLYAEGSVDSAPVHDSWRSLPPGRERRHRRECTAILDAMVTVAEGRDPIPGLASVRRDLDAVHYSMRIPWVTAKWAAIAAACIVVGALSGFAFVG